MAPDRAKLFWSGRSQAVRLPKAYRIEGREVSIRRRGNAVILEPIPDNWAWLDEIVSDLDTDFLEAALEEPPQQERSALDQIF